MIGSAGSCTPPEAGQGDSEWLCWVTHPSLRQGRVLRQGAPFGTLWLNRVPSLEQGGGQHWSQEEG